MEFELNKQAEMEFCSKLITTMANKNATEEEIKRVILYSMTVIDANKMPIKWLEAKKLMDIDKLVSKYGLYMKQKMNREDIVDAED